MQIPGFAVLLAIAVAALFLGMMRQSFAARIRELRHALAESPAPGSRRPETIAPVRALIARAGVDAAAPLRLARFTQICEMRLKPGGRWLPMRAEQIVAAGAPAFLWIADGRLAPLLPIRVVDALANGQGLLEARLFAGLPLAREDDDDTAAGELLRYLAELPWAPDAMAGNPALRWRAAGENRLEVSADGPAGPERMIFTLNAAGDVVAAETPSRPRAENGRMARRPWRARFSDHAMFGGALGAPEFGPHPPRRRLPRRGEAAWLLNGGEFIYWRGEIRDWAGLNRL